MKLVLNRRNILIIAAVVIVAIVLFWSKADQNSLFEGDNSKKEVTLASISDLSQDKTYLSLIGSVSSRNEVSVRSESQGVIKTLYKKQGQYIPAGAIIAEIENSSQGASLAQAEAGVDAQRAALEKVRSGSREEQLDVLRLKEKNAENSLLESKNSVINSIKNIYFKESDDIYNNMDRYFRNPKTSPELNILVADFKLELDLKWRRSQIENTMKSWSSSIDAFSIEGDILSYLDEAEKNVREIGEFLDKAILVPDSDASAGTEISSWKASAIAARANVTSALSTISSARNDVNAKISAYNIAKKQLEEGISGSRSEDISLSEAGLKQALASLALAQVGLEKTIIRSPISGTINKLNIEKGDFVSIFEDVATVSNNNALEITSYITEDDRKNIKVGSKALIDGVVDGVVSEIAPAIDATLRKIEIKVGITSENSGLTNGQSVKLEIERDVKMTQDSQKEIMIPVSDVKVAFDGDYVFSLDEDNKLVKHKVELGPIAGDKIILLSGVSPDLVIVSDARGLKEGEEVLVKE